MSRLYGHVPVAFSPAVSPTYVASIFRDSETSEENATGTKIHSNHIFENFVHKTKTVYIERSEGEGVTISIPHVVYFRFWSILILEFQIRDAWPVQLYTEAIHSCRAMKSKTSPVIYAHNFRKRASMVQWFEC